MKNNKCAIQNCVVCTPKYNQLDWKDWEKIEPETKPRDLRPYPFTPRDEVWRKFIILYIKHLVKQVKKWGQHVSIEDVEYKLDCDLGRGINLLGDCFLSDPTRDHFKALDKIYKKDHLEMFASFWKNERMRHILLNPKESLTYKMKSEEAKFIANQRKKEQLTDEQNNNTTPTRATD